MWEDLREGSVCPPFFPIFLSPIFRFCPRAIVIPGRGPIANDSEFRFYNDLLVSVRANAAALKKQGKSLHEMIALKPTAASTQK
jgi:hypothetical protein